MIILNNNMFLLMVKTFKKTNKISKRLLPIINQGVVNINGCYLFKYFYERNRHIKLSDFVDKTGYECFINSFHVDYYSSKNILMESLLFIEQFIIEWNKLNGSINIQIILSETKSGYVFRFHRIRENEIWVDSQRLDLFRESCLVISPVTDMQFLS